MNNNFFYLSFGTTDIWYWIILCPGCPSITECFAASFVTEQNHMVPVGDRSSIFSHLLLCRETLAKE